jgi:hypothetical protein
MMGISGNSRFPAGGPGSAGEVAGITHQRAAGRLPRAQSAANRRLVIELRRIPRCCRGASEYRSSERADRSNSFLLLSLRSPSWWMPVDRFMPSMSEPRKLMLRARRFLVPHCISLCAHLILSTAQKSRHCSDRHSTCESIPQKKQVGL